MSDYPFNPYIVNVTDLLERLQYIVTQNLDQRYDETDILYKYLAHFPKSINILISNEAWDYVSDAHRFTEAISYCHQFFQSVFGQLSIFEEIHDLNLFTYGDQKAIRFTARPIQI